MRNKLLTCTLLSSVFPLTSIASTSAPNVAVDIAPLHSLVSQVMEGAGKPELLIPAEASPHEYTLRPSQAQSLSDAQIVFWMGEGLTPWLQKAIDNVADSAQKIEMLALDSTVKYEFREGATFEEHAHDEGNEEEHHDGLDDEHKEDEHGWFDGFLSLFSFDDHEADNHEKEEHHAEAHDGAHAFEWAGAFQLSAGEYVWTFAKVDGGYADSMMKMVILASDLNGKAAIEAQEETAEGLIESSSAIKLVHGDALTPNASNAYQVVFDPKRNITEYRVIIEKEGVYTFFTEHMPFEFEADEHFFKDTDKRDIEPIAQEPEAGHHDHHGGVDPHAWLDPENAKTWITEIKEVLSKNDPQNANIYDHNAKQAIAELDSLMTTTRNKVNSLGELKFIVFHDAYQYFEKRFGISAAGSISLGDAEDPSPARIKEIRNTVQQLGVNCVFTEPQYNPGLVKNVFAGSTISTTAIMDPLGASIEVGSKHYAALIEGMVSSLSQCKK
jgi:ABC-type Zn2+ transport system substrate-binding protein/surface adhesin